MQLAGDRASLLFLNFYQAPRKLPEPVTIQTQFFLDSDPFRNLLTQRLIYRSQFCRPTLYHIFQLKVQLLKQFYQFLAIHAFASYV